VEFIYTQNKGIVEVLTANRYFPSNTKKILEKENPSKQNANYIPLFLFVRFANSSKGHPNRLEGTSQ